MQAFCVYILRCRNGSYYVGHTSNLEKRISEHKFESYSGYTKKLLPVELVFSHVFSTRHQAFVAERQIKGWNRKKKEALIKGDWKTLQQLAKKEFKRSRTPSIHPSSPKGSAGHSG